MRRRTSVLFEQDFPSKQAACECKISSMDKAYLVFQPFNFIVLSFNTQAQQQLVLSDGNICSFHFQMLKVCGFLIKTQALPRSSERVP